MVTMNGENWNGDIIVRILIVHHRKPIENMIHVLHLTKTHTFLHVLLHTRTCTHTYTHTSRQECTLQCCGGRVSEYSYMYMYSRWLWVLGVTEVDGLVAAKLNGAGLASHAVVPQQLHGAVEDLSRRLVVMEQVSPQQDEVHLRQGAHMARLLLEKAPPRYMYVYMYKLQAQDHIRTAQTQVTWCGCAVVLPGVPGQASAPPRTSPENHFPSPGPSPGSPRDCQWLWKGKVYLVTGCIACGEDSAILQATHLRVF